MNLAMQKLNDTRGLWLVGHLALHTGELVLACFAYPSATKKCCMGGMPYCLKICETPNGARTHAVFGDDKFEVLAHKAARDGSYVTLMLPYELSCDRRREIDGLDTGSGADWTDSRGVLWSYEQGYFSQAERRDGHKYQFFPRSDQVLQAMRDLVPQPVLAGPQKKKRRLGK